MKKMIKKISLFCLANFLYCSLAFSTPKEIILIRHADKWVQKNPGPFLSPRGQWRAEKFVSYYLAHFQKPDFIFASKPAGFSDPNDDASARPVQTVIPLANALAYQNPNGYNVHTPYVDKEYVKLTHELLVNPIYQQKIILICWHHGRLNDIVRQLGVIVPLKKWKQNNFDTVYDLKYNAQGKLISFQVLTHQYPINGNPTWKALANYKSR